MMKKMISVLTLLLLCSVVSADKAVMGYFTQGAPYHDYVIVYTYTRSDGGIGVSHCRTRNSANLQYAFMQQTMLNINDCDLSYKPPADVDGSSSSGAFTIPSPPSGGGYSSQRAF